MTRPAGPLVAALDAKSRRRQLTLPAEMEQPGPQWAAGYAAAARDARLDPEVGEVGVALQYVGHCLDPLLWLWRERAEGRWLPELGWRDQN